MKAPVFSLHALMLAVSLTMTVPQSAFAAAEPLTYQTTPVQVSSQSGETLMTLEQAMAHPDWLGRQPEASFWSQDSQTVYYQRKQQGNELRDWFAIPLHATATSNQVGLQQLDNIGAQDQVFSADGQYIAWSFEGQVLVKHVPSGVTTQLTRNRDDHQSLMFLTDGRLSFRQGWDFYAVDLNSGRMSLVASLVNAKAPAAPAIPDSYLAKEQHKLIGFIALEHKNAQDQFNSQQQLQQQSDALAPAPIYLAADKQIVGAYLSPKADRLVVALGDKYSQQERDIMPNYITATGDIAAQPVRSRVHDAKPQTQQLLLIDLKTAQQQALSFSDLPGFDEDVLAAVKSENAQRQGKKYTSVKAPRAISLLGGWGVQDAPVRWNPAGTSVAVMLRAWDNKDRWLATVDLQQGKLIPQHRLHDEAWVNYSFNDFGWNKAGDSLWYLSEQSGYSHLYLQKINGKAKKLTAGTFEVSDPVLSRDGAAIYFRANQSHPGIYNLFKLDLASGQQQQLTSLTGNLTYQLSPDESKILLTYSTSVQLPELYLMDNQPGAKLQRLTFTTSEQFSKMALQAPQVIAVPSSHGKQPVFAKLYLPKDYKQGQKRRAVIFNHGAGYLQNSDLGWSNYFREFFFHNLLTQQGYVVLDMDYRASAGYGRDWRTAIYRRMGTPETEDLMDGVKWLVDNANVDVKRVGTYGGSYGGFMTFMAMFTQPDLFKAGSALRPVGDWAYYNHGYTSNILNTPDVDPIAYERSSPIYFTQGLKNQLLINAPMVDDNVFFQDVVRVVQRLIEQEINTFETAIFPVEPHGFRQPSSWLDEYRRIYKLFEREL
jgi:dipeptidyl aminopeptidase/acylaminoacyl peptidase